MGGGKSRPACSVARHLNVLTAIANPAEMHAEHKTQALSASSSGLEL